MLAHVAHERTDDTEGSFGPTALLTPANIVTIARIAGTIVVVVLILTEQWWWAFGLGLGVALSDTADGIMARREGATRSGAFLDPLADKLLVGGVGIALVIVGLVWWLPIALILVREVVISWFRVYAVRRGASVPASTLGKIKTLVTMGGLSLITVPIYEVQVAGRVVVWVAVAVAWISGVDYLWRSQTLIAKGQRSDAD